MKKFGISMVAFMVALTAVSCGKLNKYTPYKASAEALAKAYETATKAIKKADTKQEVAGIFKSLALAHEKSSPVIIKYQEMFPELRDKNHKDYPEEMKETAGRFEKAMKDFIKTSQTSSNLRPFQNDKDVEAAVNEWTKELEQLNAKLEQLRKEK
jgi:hypothetical protein